MSIPELYPPWPDNSRMIGVLFCAVAAIIAFAWGAASGTISKRRQSLQSLLATGSLVLGLALIIGYLLAYNSYVVVETQMVGNDQRKLRFVIGADPPAHSAVGPNAGYLDLLRDNQYDPERIWTPESLRRSRFLLFGSFVAAFSLLTFGMGLLAAASARSRPPARHRVAGRSAG
jgi:hypothetical protein